MKRGAILLTLLLLATIAGTYAVYELYVKQRMKELGEHTAQEKILRDRIVQLENAFSKTVPEVYLESWRRSTQPWSDAVQGRSQFFTLGNFDQPVEIPEEVIPKVYYKNELPKRIQALRNYGADKQVQISDVNCGVPGPDAFGEGKTPTREEIAKHLQEYDYCSALTKMFVDAKPSSLDPLRMWPELEEPVQSGVIKTRTTGVSMQMSTQNLVKFLDGLAQSDRYFRVEEFRIANSNLHATDPALAIELVVTQAYFEPAKKAAGAGVAGGVGAPGINDRLTSLFGGAPASGTAATPRRGRATEPELSAWQQFRRTWLPF